VLRGVTRPVHNETHVLIIVTALFLPFVSFDLARLGDVPFSAWLFCGAFLLMQVVHTAFHYARPQAVHAVGPEILFQPIICVWVVLLRDSLDPTLWYRGLVGTFFFCLETLFLSLTVLMLIYMAELTSSPGDDIDLARQPWRTADNAAFLTATPTALMVTLAVVFRDPVWLVAAIAVFAGVRALLPPARPTPRMSHPGA
jgi:hypothetical protein